MFSKGVFYCVVCFILCGLLNFEGALAAEDTTKLICEIKDCSGGINCREKIGLNITFEFPSKSGSVVSNKRENGDVVLYKTFDDAFVSEGSNFKYVIDRVTGKFRFVNGSGFDALTDVGECRKRDVVKNKF